MPTPNSVPVTDPDGVRWNASAWFGTQIGVTCWMLTAFVAYVGQAPWLGVLFLGGFAAVNAFGFCLWSNRRRCRFFRAAQGMLLVGGGSALVALLAFDFLGSDHLKHNLIWQANRPDLVEANRSEFRTAYLVLGLMIPALLIQFEVQGRQARRRSESGG